GTMDWGLATVQGGGTLAIASGATLILSQQQVVSPKLLGSNSSRCDLNNSGTIQWYGGDLTLNGSVLLNRAGGQVFLYGNDRLLGTGDSRWAFFNRGTVTKEIYDPPGNSDPNTSGLYQNNVGSSGQSDLAYLGN